MARLVPRGAWGGVLICLWAALGPQTACVGQALGPLPRARLYAVHPAGGAVGTSFDVEITAGEDLEGVTALVFSHEQITASAKISEPKPTWPVAQRSEKRFKVHIGPDVPTGVYEVRALGNHGLSNARAFVVGASGERLEASSNQSYAEAQELPLGAVMNGVVQKGKFDYFQFKASSGQRLLIECMAQRIDSALNATLTLFDGSGREITHDRDTKGLDPLLDLTVPEDGTYVIRVHDFLYGGGTTSVSEAQYFYRLRVRSEPYVDFVFPPAGQPGTRQYTAYGWNLPNSTPAEHLQVHGRPLEQTNIELEIPEPGSTSKILIEQCVRPFQSMLASTPLPVVSPQTVLPLYYATAPVVVEQEPNDDPDQAQKITPPCEIAGQFHPLLDLDYFEFDAKKDDVYFIDVFSHRLGLPTDPYLLIQQLPQVKASKEGVKNGNGEEAETGPKDLHELDGTHGKPEEPGDFIIASNDPSHRFVVPADGTYRLVVRDLHASGRGDLFYRLAIRPPQPDFRLVTYRHGYKLSETKKRIGTSPWPMVLRRGAAEQIAVRAFRLGGFDGDIDLEVASGPPGVAAAKTTIYSGSRSAPLLLRASKDAQEWAGPIKIIGRARVGDQEIVREVRAAEVQLGRARGQKVTTRFTEVRLTGDMTLAVDADWQFPFTIECEDRHVAMSRAGKINIPIKFSRQESFEKDVNVVLENQPNRVSAPGITFKANKDSDQAQLQLRIEPKAKPSRHPMVLTAETEVSIVRHPGALAAAREAKQQIDKAHGELAAAASAAAEAQRQAEEKLSALAEPKNESDPKTDPAYRNAAEALGQAKLAAEQAQERLKQAEEALAEAEKRISAAKKGEAEPERCRIKIPVALINLDIKPAPVELELTPESAELVAGEKVEIIATIRRLFGFEGEARLELIAQEALVGVSLEGGTVTIEKAAERAKLVLLTTDQTPAGVHELRFKARLQFEGTDLEFEPPLQIEVAAPPPTGDND